MVCDDLEGWDEVRWEIGGRFKREGLFILMYEYLWLIHVDVWQKPTQYGKAIILQLNFFKNKKHIKLKRKKKQTMVANLGKKTASEHPRGPPLPLHRDPGAASPSNRRPNEDLSLLSEVPYLALFDGFKLLWQNP